MTLPSSGQISMRDILLEKLGNPSLPPAAESVSLRGLSSDSYNDFTYTGGAASNIAGTPNSDEPYKVSEFHGYRGFDLTFPSNYTNTQIISAGSLWSQTDTDDNGGLAMCGTQLSITFTTTPFYALYYNPITGFDYYSGSTNTSTNQTWLLGTKLTGCSKIEARWVANDMDFDFDNTSSSDDVGWGISQYLPGLSSQYGVMRAGTQSAGGGDGTNIDYTGSWVEITPSALGGSGNNTVQFSLQVEARYGDAQGKEVEISSGSSTSYVGVEFRINSDDNNIKLVRSPSSGVSLRAVSYEYPEFTCIMPDMLVNVESRGHVRIGDVVVGDRILAKGDLNDDSVPDQYVEVTEARTHTRSGYWDVDGLHITNDHPVWLTDKNDNTNRQWVKVEDMLDGINRTYISEQVDPVYLETNPGWYYVFTPNAEQRHKTTVSGNYAPTTE